MGLHTHGPPMSRRLHITLTDAQYAYLSTASERTSISVACDTKRLNEVRICMSKDFKFQDCPDVAQRSMTQVFAGLLLTTLATLMYEVLLPRVLSVTMFYHFAFMAVSLAMFGMTVGAVIVHLRPGRYTAIEVRDPKKRLVSAAPFRDRVVHHASASTSRLPGSAPSTSPTTRLAGYPQQ